jgi:predicted transposase YbfD/YdcC
VGVTLAQHAVDDKTNAITAVEPIFQRLVLEGRMVTMDTLLTQRHIAQTIVDEGGNYVMIVKENQPQLRADIALVLTLPPVGDRQATAQTVDLGHGRIEQRNLTTRAALVGYSDWPGLAQLFALGRHGVFQKTGKERVEVVLESRACVPSGPHPSACSPWYEDSGRLKIRRIGCAMARLMKIAHRCAVATSPKFWPRYATPRLVCSGMQAMRTLRRQAVGSLPSRYKRWLSSGLHWKTK